MDLWVGFPLGLKGCLEGVCLRDVLPILKYFQSLSSCWVFQPVGRWFFSQDNKRSLDDFYSSGLVVVTKWSASGSGTDYH